MNTDSSPDLTAGEGLPLPVAIRTQVERGSSVGATARAVGYRKPGAFSDAFHRITGQYPSIYLATRG